MSKPAENKNKDPPRVFFLPTFDVQNKTLYTVPTMLPRLLITLGIGIAWLLPTGTWAMQVQSFEFGTGELNADWRVQKIQMSREPTGIVLTTESETGTFLTTASVGFLPQAGALVTSMEPARTVYFIWLMKDDPSQKTYGFPIDIRAGQMKESPFGLRHHVQWDTARLSTMGLAIPPHTTVTIHQLSLRRWNALEMLQNALQSFLVMDEYRPYSINFVWGPQIAWTPVERAGIYKTADAPSTLSAAYGMNAFLLGSLLMILGASYFVCDRTRRKQWILRRWMSVVIVAWIIFDLRMGGEFLSWVHADFSTYISAPIGERVLRDRKKFYDFADMAAKHVQDRKSYLFFAEQEWPYLGNIRYRTYPALPDISPEATDTWVIYDRRDIAVDDAGQISFRGQPVSAPGRILERFDATSFVFRTFSSPSQ